MINCQEWWVTAIYIDMGSRGMFLSPPEWGKNTYYAFIDIFSLIQLEILFRCYKDATPYIINSTSQRIWSIVEWNRKLVMTILISCGYQSVKKMRFQHVRRQVIKKLSRKEMVIGESRTMDFARLSQALKMMSRSIIWKKLKHEWICDRCDKPLKRNSNMSRYSDSENDPENICKKQ